MGISDSIPASASLPCRTYVLLFEGRFQLLDSSLVSRNQKKKKKARFLLRSNFGAVYSDQVVEGEKATLVEDDPAAPFTAPPLKKRRTAS